MLCERPPAIPIKMTTVGRAVRAPPSSFSADVAGRVLQMRVARGEELKLRLA